MRILDLDNCISNDERRIALIRWDEEDLAKRYALYHSACWIDEPGNHDLFIGEPGVIVITGRPVSLWEPTHRWLVRHGVLCPLIIMRADGDHKPAVELKRESLRNARRWAESVFVEITEGYDDREDVVAMYREEGLKAEVRCLHKVSAYDPRLEPK